MPDIFLIQPPIRDFYLTAKRTIPYGLACIAASLIKDGFSVEIFDSLATSKSKIVDLSEEMAYLKAYYGKPDCSPFALFHHFKHFGYSFEYIAKKAKDSCAFLVGISSLFTAYSDEAIQTALMVKKFYPSCKIVLGGHHPTTMPESVIKCNAVDFVIRGEGEAAMPLLAKALQEDLRGQILLNWQNPAGLSSELEAIPGIVFRRTNGTLCINEPAIMDNPDDYPLPATHLINHTFYQRKKRGSAVIVASRGCPMRCSYCSVGASGLKYRRRSAESVIREIEHAVHHYNAGFIDFEDENLSLNRKWFLTLLHEIRNRFSSLELRAMNGLFPPSLDDEVIQMMKSAGFKTLNLSLGSTSKEQLKRFQRPDVRQSFENAVELAQKYHLKTVCYVITGAPRQKAEDSVADLLYLFQKKVLAGVSVFYPAPGSPDFELCRNLNLLPEKFSLMRSSCLPITHTSARLETVTILRLARILNFMKSLVDEGEEIPEIGKGKKVDSLSLNPPYEVKDSLADEREEVPETGKGKKVDSLSLNPPYEVKDRRALGKFLLGRFLQDGRISGITPEGEVYDHKISMDIVRKLLTGITN